MILALGGFALVNSDGAFLISGEVSLIVAIVLMLIAVFLFAFGLRLYFKKISRRVHSFKRVVLLIRVPKEPEEQAKKEESVDKKENLKEIIAIAETFYANLGGVGRYRGWEQASQAIKKAIRGEHGHFSLEIVSHNGLIKFYIVVPPELEEYIEQQVHAQYPNACVEVVEDYNMFGPTGHIEGTYLAPSRDAILPLKTYKKIDSDPLEGITSNLSKIGQDEGAAIQIVIRPVSTGWRGRGQKIAEGIHKGKRVETALRELSLVNRITDWFVNLPLNLGDILQKAFFPGKPEEEGASQTKKREENSLRSAPVRVLKREEQLIEQLEEKLSRPLFNANVRLIASAASTARAKIIVRGMVGSFAQFASHQSGNKLLEKWLWFKHIFIDDFIYRNFREHRNFVLSSEELAGMYHPPLPSAETPNILWLGAREAPPPVDMPAEGIILGRTAYRGREVVVRLKEGDRRRHVYVIGMTGVGKSVLLANMVIQDIKEGKGVCIIDPHGSLVEDVIPHIPKERAEDVVYFNPADLERPVGLNMLEAETPNEMDFACQEMISIFYKLVTDPAMIGPMFEHNMRNAMLTLMADKNNPGTITEVPRMFTDTDYQELKLKEVTDPMVRAFWEKEMAKTSDFHKSEMLGYLISKVGRFVENEMIRNIIGQPKSGFDFKQVMNNQKILLVNLSKGQIGEVNSQLLGLIFVSKLQMAALSRASMPEEQRKDFYLYIDEFQNYVTDSIATILAEARKYKLNLIMAHQYIGQLVHGAGVEGKGQDTKIKDAVFGNAGTMICFRIGVEDTETMAKQFKPTFNEYDLINIPKFTAFLRLLIDNASSKPFNMMTYAPKKGDPIIADKIKQLSRLKYGRDKSAVEAEILERARLGEAEKEADVGDIERSL